MSKKPNWTWHIYFYLYATLIAANTFAFFSPSSPIYIFYQIMIGFNIVLLVPYLMHAFSLILNIVCVIGFFFFLQNKVIINARFWRILLVFRLAFDILGRSYDSLLLRSMFHQDKALGWQLLITLIIFYIPSYVAIYKYGTLPKEKNSSPPQKSN